MKTLKRIRNFVLAGLLAAVFVFLHFHVYLDYGFAPVIQSYTETEINSNRLKLCDEKFPSYLSPFQKATYIYCVDGTEETVMEQSISIFADSVFSYDLEPNLLIEYWEGENERWMFARGFTGRTYANWIFFLVQYMLVAAFAYLLLPRKKS